MEAKKKANTKRNQSLAAMRSLSQQDAALLINKPSTWLRDHPEIGCRNEDNTYDGPALVRAVMNTMSDLSDPELKRRKDEAETLKVEAQARQAQHDLDIAQGAFMPVEHVEALLAEILSAYTEIFTALPAKITTHISESEASKVIPVIDKDIKMALTGITEMLNSRLLGKTDQVG